MTSDRVAQTKCKAATAVTPAATTTLTLATKGMKANDAAAKAKLCGKTNIRNII